MQYVIMLLKFLRTSQQPPAYNGHFLDFPECSLLIIEPFYIDHLPTIASVICSQGWML